jgi:hypothetical protein
VRWPGSPTTAVSTRSAWRASGWRSAHPVIAPRRSPTPSCSCYPNGARPAPRDLADTGGGDQPARPPRRVSALVLSSFNADVGGGADELAWELLLDGVRALLDVDGDVTAEFVSVVTGGMEQAAKFVAVCSSL